MIWIMLISFPQTSLLLTRKLCCMCFEDNEAVIKMIIKGRSPTMRHVSRTHRVALDVLYLIESFWTRKSRSNTLTPKTNSQTYWPRENFTLDEWNHLLCLINISHFSSPIVLKHQKAWGKPDMKVNFLWACKLSSNVERCDPLYTLTHQATQNGTLIKLGLPKSGDLMNWWKIEKGRPVGNRTQQTDRLIVENDKMNSYTDAQSEMSLESRSFLHKGKWSSAKEAESILKRCNKRQRQTFCDMENVYVFYIASICIHGELLRHSCIHIKNTEDLTMK